MGALRERSRRLWAAAIVVFVAAAAAVAAAAPYAGAAARAGTVKIGLITSVTGPASVYYPSIKQVTQMAVDEINASGGVNGDKVQLVTADSNTTPAQAATQSRRLALSEGVKMEFVEDIVADRDAALPFATQANIPFIYAWSYEGGPLQSGTDTVCHKNFWATGQVPNNLVPKPIQYLVQTKGWKQWYLIGSDYKWPRTMNKHISVAITQNGGKVLGQEYAPLTQTDFSSIVTKLKALPKGSAIVVNLVGGSLINFFKQWHAAGGSNDRVIAFAMDEQTLGAAGGAAAGAWGAYDYYANGKTPGNTAFLKKLKAKYDGHVAVPTSLSEEGYEAIWLWALAARKAGSFDLDKVNAAMTKVKFFGPRGWVQFLPNHHIALPDILARAGNGSYYTDFVKNFGVIAPADQCPASAWA
ncbi:MAG TPA: ABC transporter substrate-binding protein [Gaiellaceae bacterium]|nr:ABC transporter substrate-binding protein [Gaiellaceae bacterium]